MRTKTLILTAALSAASLATSMAQVYSVNAVGYVNVTLKKGYNLIANPLNNGGNTLIDLIPPTTALPDSTLVLTWNPAGGTIGQPDADVPEFFPGAGWAPAGRAIPPGQAFWLFIPNTAPQANYTITFVGEVPQSTAGQPLSTPVYGGYRWNALASAVPQAGRVSTDLAFPPQAGDLCYIWDKTASPSHWLTTVYEYIVEGTVSAWTDGVGVAEPQLGVGEGFFLLRRSATTSPWTRDFSVNQP